MTAIKDALRSRYSQAIEREPPDEAYKVKNQGAPKIFSLDKIHKKISASVRRSDPQRKFRITGMGAKRCDDLVVLHFDKHKKTGFYVIERKTNPPMSEVDEVRKQLQGGVHFIEDFIHNNPELHQEPFDFLPVLVSNKISSRYVKKQLKQQITSNMCSPQPIQHVSKGKFLPPDLIGLLKS